MSRLRNHAPLLPMEPEERDAWLRSREADIAMQPRTAAEKRAQVARQVARIPGPIVRMMTAQNDRARLLGETAATHYHRSIFISLTPAGPTPARPPHAIRSTGTELGSVRPRTALNSKSPLALVIASVSSVIARIAAALLNRRALL